MYGYVLSLCMVESCEKWFEIVRILPKRERDRETENELYDEKAATSINALTPNAYLIWNPFAVSALFFCSFFSRFLSPTHFTKQRRWQCLNWRRMSEQSDDDFRAYRGSIFRCYRCCCCTLQLVYKMVRRKIQEKIHCDWDTHECFAYMYAKNTCCWTFNSFQLKNWWQS